MGQKKKQLNRIACEICEVSFIPRRCTQKTCSKECSKVKASRRSAAKYVKKVFNKKTCLICDKEYTPAKSYQKFCSKECVRARDKKTMRAKAKKAMEDGNSTYWLKIRFIVLNRDGFKCQYCGRGVDDGTTLQVDHIHPKSKGGDYSLGNLTTACFECNQGKKDILLNKRLSDAV